MTRRAQLMTAWLPAVLYMLLIWVLSSQTLDISTASFPLRDKGVHFVEYGVLGALLAHAVQGTAAHWRPLAIWGLSVGLTILWGMLDEIHQAFVPGRSADIYDVVADGVGALAGAGVRVVVLGRWLNVPPKETES